MPETAATTEPAVVVLSKFPVAIEEMVRFEVDASVENALVVEEMKKDA